jgi:hypothetical protein
MSHWESLAGWDTEANHFHTSTLSPEKADGSVKRELRDGPKLSSWGLGAREVHSIPQHHCEYTNSCSLTTGD